MDILTDNFPQLILLGSTAKLWVSMEPRISNFAHSLSPRDLEIINLMAVGLTTHDVATKQHYSNSTIKNRLTRLYDGLEVSGASGAAFLLCQEGLLDTVSIEQRVDMDSYKTLSKRQVDIMEHLLENNDATNEELSLFLDCSVATARNYLAKIKDKVLPKDERGSRILLALGYSLYKSRNTNEL